MPGTLSVKKDGAYVAGGSSDAKIKVAGAYVDATNVRVKAGGVYSSGGTMPALSASPVISGVLETGGTLTVTPGTWTGNPTPGILHQWEADGVPIPGARGLTYILTVNEAGKDIVCVEIAVNSSGSAQADSNVLSVPVVLGPELLLDPSFDAGTAEWNANGRLFSGGSAVLQSVGMADSYVETIGNVVTAGKRYHFEMVVSAIGGAQLKFNHGDGEHFTTIGTHAKLIDVASNGVAGIICSNIFATATVTSMSVKEVL